MSTDSSPDFGRFQTALAQHLAEVKGLRACHAFVRFGQEMWFDAARIGPVQEDLAHPILQAFDPEAGGAVEPLAQGNGWLASYCCGSDGVQLCLLFYLDQLAAHELQDQLALIEAKVGWLLVSAIKTKQDQIADLDLPVEIGAAVLLEAAQVRSKRELADQWVARLERALTPDFAAVLWVDGSKISLAAQSGGGEVERTSRSIEALKDIARLTIEARSPILQHPDVAQERPQKMQVALDTALQVIGAQSAIALPIYQGDPCRAVVISIMGEGARAIPSAEACDQIAQVLSQALTIQERAHPNLNQKLRTWLMDMAIVIFGKRAAKVKLFASAIMLILIILLLVPTTARPAFEARIEARNRYVVSAPFDGFLSEAPFQLGDTVAQGDVILALDDADFRLQLARNMAEVQRLDGEIQTARAQRDTAKVRGLDAQLRQAKVQSDLLTHQLEQTQLVAVRAGAVIGGDAWRRVGGRVRLGEPLLEVADPSSYAVALFIDESWMADIETGATGKLLLAAFPDRPIDIKLDQVTSDASAQSGVNAFLAWAVLPADQAAALPLLEGMRGIVRVDAYRTNVLAAYTRGLRQWFARTLWRWV